MSQKGKAFTGVWQDREIRFDLPVSQLQPTSGEVEIDSMNSVEDTKGNNGIKGALSVTNLRLIWVSHNNPSVNLSIGMSTIQNTNIKSAKSRLRGDCEALYVMTKFNNSRFEFIFTNLVKGSPRLFTTTQSVLRAYDTSKLYRDLKLRGAIIKDKSLILLPDEIVYDQVGGVWNLSSDQGNLGTFFISNIRLVWHANLAENFNVSIPYMQFKSIKIRDSRFGKALVVETTQRSGNYILGFRVDPFEKLKEVHQILQRLFEVYSKNPIFGVKFQSTPAPKTLQQIAVERKADEVEIVDTGGQYDALSAYLASASKTSESEPVYSEELGLAVEKLPDNFTVSSLWKVQT